MISNFFKVIRYIYAAFALFACAYTTMDLVYFGSFLPFSGGPDLTHFEESSLRTSLFGVLATSAAVAVALFKDEIIRLYKKANLVIDNTKILFTEEMEEEISDPSYSHSSKIAKRYILKIPVINKGKIAARGCEIELETIDLEESGSPNCVPYKSKDAALKWNENQEIVNTIIMSTAEKYFVLFEIINPTSELEEGGVASNTVTSISPTIKVGNLKIRLFSQRCKYVLGFCIHSENSDPVRHEVTIDLNHNWETRWNEMQKHVKVENKSKKS